VADDAFRRMQAEDQELAAFDQEIAAEADEADRLRIAVEQGNAGVLLDRTPPPERYVIDGLIPEPITGAIVAPGATGKTFWLLQLGLCVATGLPFFGSSVRLEGGVLMLTAEEDQDTIARRLHAVARSYGMEKWRDEWPGLCRNLHVLSVASRDNRLTERVGGNIVVRPVAIQVVIDAAISLPGLRLIILDPVSRFRSGDENDNEAATRFVEALEIIREATGVTVLCAHHSRKGANGDTADSIRGASAFVDALRFAATLASPDPESAKKLGLDDDERRRLVRFNVVKANCRTDMDTFWMQRGAGGVLEWVEAPQPVSGSAAQRGDERYRETLPKLTALIGERATSGTPLTARRLREYAGTSGIFGMGRDNLLAVLNRAVEEREIRRHEDGSLHLW